jgi:hypothetical protein
MSRSPTPRPAAGARGPGPGPPATRRTRPAGRAPVFVRPAAQSWRTWDPLCEVARLELRRRPRPRPAP